MCILWCVCDRNNEIRGAFKDKSDPSTRLKPSSRPMVPYLFSVVELLVFLRNIIEHPSKIVPDIGSFVRTNYPFLLSHVWHVRLHANSKL